MAEAEVISDGTTVWVNAQDGMCLGRFGRRAVDVHADTASQAAGAHCCDCFPRSADLVSDWKRFVAGMLKFHGVDVEQHHIPSRS